MLIKVFKTDSGLRSSWPAARVGTARTRPDQRKPTKRQRNELGRRKKRGRKKREGGERSGGGGDASVATGGQRGPSEGHSGHCSSTSSMREKRDWQKGREGSPVERPLEGLQPPWLLGGINTTCGSMGLK